MAKRTAPLPQPYIQQQNVNKWNKDYVSFALVRNGQPTTTTSVHTGKCVGFTLHSHSTALSHLPDRKISKKGKTRQVPRRKHEQQRLTKDKNINTVPQQNELPLLANYGYTRPTRPLQVATFAVQARSTAKLTRSELDQHLDQPGRRRRDSSPKRSSTATFWLCYALLWCCNRNNQTQPFVRPHVTAGRHKLTDGEENERPPILPPDLAARASPGAEKATAATVAATANFFAMSVVKASHGVLLLSPSPPAAMRSGMEAVEDLCGARVSPAVMPVPTKRAEGAGTKAEAGAHASRPSTAADLMFLL